MKTSGRSGRFKKKLVALENLMQEAPLVESRMAPFHELHRQGLISNPEFCGIYIIIVLSIRYPGTWCGAKRPFLCTHHNLNYVLDHHFESNVQKRIQGMNLGEIFNNFALKSTPESVNRALLSWSIGQYPLELMFRIPRPIEVLDQQRHGHRCLTILTESKSINHYILGERDHLSFTMHDLIHADHFYFHNDSYRGQLGFYELLYKSIVSGFFDSLLQNADFKDEFDYVVSDMNAYAIHLMKCLKSAIIHYGSIHLFNDWIKNFPAQESLMLLNTKEYQPAIHDQIILDWLHTQIV